MSKIKDLLVRIRTAVKAGTMQADAALIDEITYVVKGELDSNQINFSTEQHRELFITNNHMFPDMTMEALVEAQLRRGLMFGRK